MQIALREAELPFELVRVDLRSQNFIASEIHKSFGPLFSPVMPDEAKDQFRTRIGRRFDYVARELDGRLHWMGPTFTIADGYLFNMLQWAPHNGADLGRWPPLTACHARVAERPTVRAALAAESVKAAHHR